MQALAYLSVAAAATSLAALACACTSATGSSSRDGSSAVPVGTSDSSSGTGSSSGGDASSSDGGPYCTRPLGVDGGPYGPATLDDIPLQTWCNTARYGDPYEWTYDSGLVVVSGPTGVDSVGLYAFDGLSRRLVAILGSANGGTFCAAGNSDFTCPTDPNALGVEYQCVLPGIILSNDLCVEAGLPGPMCANDNSCTAPYRCVRTVACCPTAANGSYCGTCLRQGSTVDAGDLDACQDGGLADAPGQ